MTVEEFARMQSRRNFLERTSGGLGMLALWNLLARDGRAADGVTDVNPLRPKKSHFPAKARNVIFLFMAGGPSHIDLFDPKPSLRNGMGKRSPSH